MREAGAGGAGERAPTLLRRTAGVGLRAEQKLFTAEEVCALLGIAVEELEALARSRHIGHPTPTRPPGVLFDRNDLAVLTCLAAQPLRGGD